MTDDAMLQMNHFWNKPNTMSVGITTIDVIAMTWVGT
jgi:hypothetical protein